MTKEYNQFLYFALCFFFHNQLNTHSQTQRFSNRSLEQARIHFFSGQTLNALNFEEDYLIAKQILEVMIFKTDL